MARASLRTRPASRSRAGYQTGLPATTTHRSFGKQSMLAHGNEATSDDEAFHQRAGMAQDCGVWDQATGLNTACLEVNKILEVLKVEGMVLVDINPRCRKVSREGFVAMYQLLDRLQHILQVTRSFGQL